MSFRVRITDRQVTYLVREGSVWKRGLMPEAHTFDRRRTARAALGAWLADDGGSVTPIAVVIEKVP